MAGGGFRDRCAFHLIFRSLLPLNFWINIKPNKVKIQWQRRTLALLQIQMDRFAADRRFHKVTLILKKRTQGMKCPAARVTRADARSRRLRWDACPREVHGDRRSYRRAGSTFPHPMGWGKFLLAAAGSSGG